MSSLILSFAVGFAIGIVIFCSNYAALQFFFRKRTIVRTLTIASLEKMLDGAKELPDGKALKVKINTDGNGVEFERFDVTLVIRRD